MFFSFVLTIEPFCTPGNLHLVIGRRLNMARSIRSALALIFILAGIRFFRGGESIAPMFQQIGLGEWLRYGAAFCALSGGALLLIPSRAVLGSAIVTVMTLGALMIQAFMAIGNPAPTIVLVLLAGGSLVQAQLAEPVTIQKR